MGEISNAIGQNKFSESENLSQAFLNHSSCEYIYPEPIALIGHDGVLTRGVLGQPARLLSYATSHVRWCEREEL